VVARCPHPQGRDPVEFPTNDVAGESIGRDAATHHLAGLGAGVPDLDLVAEPGEVIGHRQSARSRADDEHPFAGARDRGIELAAARQD
jgi:hypothetical protein